MKKFFIAAVALALIATPALAKNNHNYWHGNKHNYWHGNHTYWGGGIYYNSPNFWGGGYWSNGGNYWGGGSYYNYNNYNQYQSNCGYIYVPRCVQGIGCQNVPSFVCN